MADSFLAGTGLLVGAASLTVERVFLATLSFGGIHYGNTITVHKIYTKLQAVLRGLLSVVISPRGGVAGTGGHHFSYFLVLRVS
jgi:hypothetical protein